MRIHVKLKKTKTVKTQLVVRRLIKSKLREEQSTYIVQRVIKKVTHFINLRPLERKIRHSGGQDTRVEDTVDWKDPLP
jgi:hypothetical protein